ncbi:MAG: SPASM domain-containing protein [Deltaproteobacteria bacterium]|nr:SPASM domain-containing protein [Deltaproteobacteria bacterium]
MAKPTDSKCNLDCAYCFYLKKERMYPESSFRMSEEVMEQYIRQTIEGHRVPEVTIAWQCGEPTLMGLDFFRRAVEVEKKYLRPGMRIEKTFQTNGVLVDEGVALEHTGDLYSCDHYVEPKHWLGNIKDSPIETLVSSEQQRNFGQDKSSTLPEYCRKCEFLFTCHGECPKNRVLTTPDGEPGLNWLCAGLKSFYAHTERPMRIMAELVKRGRYADEIMQILATEEAAKLKQALATSGRNDPCPCGSGRKFKKCHGHTKTEERVAVEEG